MDESLKRCGGGKKPQGSGPVSELLQHTGLGDCGATTPIPMGGIELTGKCSGELSGMMEALC